MSDATLQAFIAADAARTDGDWCFWPLYDKLIAPEVARAGRRLNRRQRRKNRQHNVSR